MKINDRALVRKQLLLGAALESQLKDNFEKIENSIERKRVVNTVIGDGQFIRKYKIKKEWQGVFTKRLTRVNSYKKKQKLQLLTAKRKEDVKEFLEDDEHSRLAPGKKTARLSKK